MTFDPDQYPLADFGFVCKRCGYALANLTKHTCPECGRAFTLEEYIPKGVMPPLYADGKQVRLTEQVEALLTRYRIPYVEQTPGVWGMMPGMDAARRGGGGYVMVSRDRYLEAIDLIRRATLGEPLPAPTADDIESAGDWTCPACGEDNPGTFEVCWHCGRERQ